MRHLAAFALIALTVIVAAVYLPLLYGKLFVKPVEKTHLLFSPVTRGFIYKEKIVGAVPQAARHKAEDHHAEIAYRDEDGTYYSRVEFEKRLPFIYYKNMELWGLLPLRLGGRDFDKQAIQQNRQVLELKSGEINDRRPQTPVWPLLESNPTQARLVFPEDRFRMTDDAMQFVNADDNIVDEALTAMFTAALTEKGFVFPARSVNGKFTILKPFDEGVFIVDDRYRVFHVKRRNGRPVVAETGIAPELKTRHIEISENQRREYYGFLLADDDSLHLLTYDNYRLIRLPLDNYDPNRMDFKLLVNPLYRTAVWSDDTVIRAVAMDADFRIVDRYTHRMSRATVTPMQRVYQVLFPFSLHLEAGGGQFLRLSLRPGGWLSLIGLAVSLAGFALVRRLRQGRLPRAAECGLVAVTGLFGWIALSFLGSGSQH
jgi:hypothetical protein